MPPQLVLEKPLLEISWGSFQPPSAEQVSLRLFWEFHNLTNGFNKCNAVQPNASSSSFLTPLEGPIGGPYCAGVGGSSAFGPGFSSPYRSQFGFRFEI